jgi:succinoglycan biosynthesis transport protein ExoP
MARGLNGAGSAGHQSRGSEVDPRGRIGAQQQNPTVETFTPEPSALEAPAIDPMVYVRALFRRRWLILGCLAVVVAIVAVWVLRQPKVYEATTSVIIDASAPKVLDSEKVADVGDNGAGNFWYNREYYETQYKVIVSRAVASRVVDRLGLQNDAAFLGLAKVQDKALQEKLMQAADAPAILQGKIKVEPVKDSHLLYIKVQDVDAERAALLANEVTDAYKAENLALKLRVTDDAEKWLAERLEQLSGQAKQSELAVYDFKKDQDMLTTSLEDRMSMVSQRLNTYNQALTEVRTKIAGLKARVDAINQARKEAQEEGQVHWAEGLVFDTLEAGYVQQLKVRYSQQKGECGELADRYLPEHPKLVACMDRLKAALKDLVHELDSIVKSSERELSEALLKERNLGALFEGAKQEAFVVNKKQIEFERLKREADNDQRLQEVVLKRLKDIELSGLVRTSNVRVLDAAKPSYAPVSPRVFLSLIIALIVGLLAGVGLALALEFLDTSIFNQEQVERWLGVTFLGIIPSIQRGKDGKPFDLIVHEQPKSAVAECCRSVRTNLLFMSPDKPLRSILITSAGPQDGKTTAAVSLAVAMAENGKRVLLVDSDMRRPRVHKVFNVGNGVGLSSLILGQGKLDDAIKSTEVPNLSVMTCGPVPPNPAELLHTEAFASLLHRLGERHDVLIIDSPPVGAVSDAVVLATQVDGTVFVLKAGNTSRDHARRSLRALVDVKARIFGAVLNDLDLEDRRYGGYYYYERYGYYGERKESPASS